MKVFYIDGLHGKRSNPGTMAEPFEVPRSAIDMDADAWFLRVGSEWFEFGKTGHREYQGTGKTIKCLNTAEPPADTIRFNTWTGNEADNHSGDGCGWCP
jgi:hypothetical protein